MFSSTSQRAHTFTCPEFMASVRMFIPHQPEPMSAVRNFLSDFCPSNGTAPNATDAADAERKWRRLVMTQTDATGSHTGNRFLSHHASSSSAPKSDSTWPSTSMLGVLVWPVMSCISSRASASEVTSRVLYLMSWASSHSMASSHQGQPGLMNSRMSMEGGWVRWELFAAYIEADDVPCRIASVDVAVRQYGLRPAFSIEYFCAGYHVEFLRGCLRGNEFAFACQHQE